MSLHCNQQHHTHATCGAISARGFGFVGLDRHRRSQIADRRSQTTHRLKQTHIYPHEPRTHHSDFLLLPVPIPNYIKAVIGQHPPRTPSPHKYQHRTGAVSCPTLIALPCFVFCLNWLQIALRTFPSHIYILQYTTSIRCVYILLFYWH